ncbi:transposase, partial [Cohaesibacter sp. CAU 1516]|uniref:transposase n=1 Tax=Cohaesibacter sp. CAU 1516 TaxID=2576038 RepID=UPI0010FD7C60
RGRKQTKYRKNCAISAAMNRGRRSQRCSIGQIGWFLRVSSYVLKNGLQWKDAPKGYGPHKTLYNRFRRWTELGVFDSIFSHLSAQDGPPDTLMIDATHLKAHRTASSLVKGGFFPATLAAQKVD